MGIGETYQIINIAFEVLKFLIVIRVILSYFPHNPDGTIIRFIYDLTEPLLSPLRRIIPVPASLPLDFSPIVAYILLEVLERLLLQLLF
ncbi:yggt family protein, putative [Heliomicrobium modesticaldum Ice1]|uniref:Yggt family protein, putative n=1 Tax=Heliobacterium modesticaldum (strain ATCC 51547 / Ice1) TaxID=498761 RepID=B0TGN8_HELMI|nr:YggT family protein [Heliomicrobium modesticaldum]ABZ84649.1 yggt family protein, putative [Heliomicrobium modesticaldum Ice1]